MSKLAKALTAAAGNAGGDNLYVEDVFSTYLYEGNGTGQVIENGINLGDANVGGSGDFDGTGDWLQIDDSSTFAFGTGDFTIEMWVYNTTNSPTYAVLWDTRDSEPDDSSHLVLNLGKPSWWYNGAARIQPATAPAINTWYHLAVARSGTSTKMFIDGTQVGSTYSDSNDYKANDYARIGSASDNPAGLNYFNGYISNLRIVDGTAVYTSAFTPPTEPLTAISGTALLTLQGTEPFTDNSGNSLTITQVGDVKAQNFGPFTSAEAGEGGLVWSKARTSTSAHALYDTQRGASKEISSSSTVAESSDNGVTAFNSDGYVIGNRHTTNSSGIDYASWTFRKAEKFFDVVTYTGDGVDGRTLAHNLGSVPGLVIIKSTNDTTNWKVWHKDLANNWLELNTTSATSSETYFPSAPTETELTLSGNGNVNGYASPAKTYIAYLFASDAGGFGDDGSESIIKCGSSTVGATESLGWEPQFIIMKRTAAAGQWYMIDNMRGWVTGGNDLYVSASTNGGDSLGDYGFATADGFTSAGIGSVGDPFIYIAIRRPMKTPESGTEVFAASQAGGYVGGTAVDPQYPTSFAVDMAIRLYTPGLASMPRLASRLTGATYLKTSSTDAEVSDGNSTWDYMDGWFGSGTTAADNYGLMFKRATGFFDVVAYTGDGVAGRTVAHNLGVKPELIISKRRNTSDNWWVGQGFTSTQLDHLLLLQSSNGDAVSNDTYPAARYYNEPTSTFYTIAADNSINGSGSTYIAYLFATLAGVSKVGSYTGNSSTQVIDCGFSTGARFVLIKAASRTGGWTVFDSARGITSSTADPFLYLNATTAEQTNVGVDIDPDASGFELDGDSSVINESGETYIFLAIA